MRQDLTVQPAGLEHTATLPPQLRSAGLTAVRHHAQHKPCCAEGWGTSRLPVNLGGDRQPREGRIVRALTQNTLRFLLRVFLISRVD